MFIPDDQKPSKRPVDETTMSYIFNFLDEALEVIHFYLLILNHRKSYYKCYLLKIANS